MELSLSEIIERIKKPKNEALIKRAKFDNDWCRFHARVSTKKEDTGDYFNTFKGNIEKILTDHSKRMAFFDLLPFPFPTTQFVNEAMDELNKAFYASDKEIHHELRNEELEEDMEIFLSDVARMDDFIDRVYNLSFESPNDIIVFDLATELTEKWPTPYAFNVTPSEVVDIEVSAKGEIEFLIFVIEKDVYAVLDSAYYRIVTRAGEGEGVYDVEIETPHELGYCPASYVWGDTIEGSNGIRRLGLLLPELPRLDRIVRSEAFEEYADLYAAHPIMQIPETPCSVEGCENGYIMRHNDKTGQDIPFPCSCQSAKSVGPGSTISVPSAAISEGIGQVVQFIDTPVDSLQYFTQKVDKIKQQCFLSLTGGEYSQVTKEQQNEKQVQQGNERKKNRLIYVAENLERFHKFYVKTMGLLRYGKDNYKGSLVKYGTEFNFETLTDAVERYEKLKAAGMPQYLLGQQLSVIENLYAKNSYEYERKASLIKLLEPMRNVPLAQMNTESMDYQVKVRFLELIDEFEMRNGSITAWGELLDLPTKIDKIKTIIYDYAKTAITKGAGGSIGQEGDSMSSVPQGRQPLPRT